MPKELPADLASKIAKATERFRLRQEAVPDDVKRFEEIVVILSSEIKRIMYSKGISQKILAALMGKSESEISKILTPGHNLTLATIAKIETAIGHSILFNEKNTTYYTITDPLSNYSFPLTEKLNSRKFIRESLDPSKEFTRTYKLRRSVAVPRSSKLEFTELKLS